MIDLSHRLKDRSKFAKPDYHARQLGWLNAVLGLLAIAVVLNQMRTYVRATPVDFSAFYCGGQAVLHHDDPYRVEPLLSCERALPVNPSEKTHVVPDPAPGYAIVPFAALSALPPRAALATYVVVLLASIVLIAFALVRLAHVPAGLATAIAFSGIAFESVTWGQVAPFAIAAIALAAVLLRRGQLEAAGLTLCFALIQPQFGLPAVLAGFIFYNRARLPIALGTAVLAFASFAAVGVRGVAEYPLELSVHSRAEVTFPAQYSLTWLVHALGGPIALSLELGSLSYALLLVAALGVVYRYRRAARTSGAAILLPAAAAVLGGSFVHDHQIKVALLTAMALFTTFPLGAAAELGVAMLIMPFANADVPFKLALLPPLIAALATTWATIQWFAHLRTEPRSAVRATIVSLSVGAYITMLFIVHHQIGGFPPDNGVAIVHHSTSLASSEWLQYINISQRRQSEPTVYLLLSKAPVWIGLVLLLWSAVAGLAQTEPGGRAPNVRLGLRTAIAARHPAGAR